MTNTRMPVLQEDKPKKKKSRKLTVILMLLFAALLGVIFFRSPASRITEIDFRGSKYSTQEELLKQSGLKKGGQYFAVSKEKVAQSLQGLKTVQKATVEKSFPGVVTVQITEYPAVAYEIDTSGSLKAILSSGASVSIDDSGIAVEKPILTGWKPSDPYRSKLCAVLADIPNELTSDISEIVPSPTPSFPDRIKLYTRSRFEVITAVSLLKDKVGYLNEVIETNSPGTITMLEADSYVPFIPETSTEEEEN